eukprot:s1818_g10.t1
MGVMCHQSAVAGAGSDPVQVGPGEDGRGQEALRHVILGQEVSCAFVIEACRLRRCRGLLTLAVIKGPVSSAGSDPVRVGSGEDGIGQASTTGVTRRDEAWPILLAETAGTVSATNLDSLLDDTELRTHKRNFWVRYKLRFPTDQYPSDATISRVTRGLDQRPIWKVNAMAAPHHREREAHVEGWTFTEEPEADEPGPTDAEHYGQVVHPHACLCHGGARKTDLHGLPGTESRLGLGGTIVQEGLLPLDVAEAARVLWQGRVTALLNDGVLPNDASRKNWFEPRLAKASLRGDPGGSDPRFQEIVSVRLVCRVWFAIVEAEALLQRLTLSESQPLVNEYLVYAADENACVAASDTGMDAPRIGSGGYLLLWGVPATIQKEAFVPTIPDEPFDWFSPGSQGIMEMLMIAHALVQRAHLVRKRRGYWLIYSGEFDAGVPSFPKQNLQGAGCLRSALARDDLLCDC